MAYRSVNPATGEVVETFASHTDGELESPLSVAHALYKSRWSKGPIEVPLEVLSRISALMEERLEELARILVQEMGKRLAEARDEVQISADIVR